MESHLCVECGGLKLPEHVHGRFVAWHVAPKENVGSNLDWSRCFKTTAMNRKGGTLVKKARNWRKSKRLSTYSTHEVGSFVTLKL